MDPDLANKFISHSLKERDLENKEGDKTVVFEDVLNQSHSAHYFQKERKGTVHVFCIKRVRNY